MAIGSLEPQQLKMMREHGHFDCWEVAVYGDSNDPASITVECVKCGIVLVELVNPEQEEREDPEREALWKLVEKHCEPEDLDELVHDLASNPASAINNAGLEEQFAYIYESGGKTSLHQLLERKKGQD